MKSGHRVARRAPRGYAEVENRRRARRSGADWTRGGKIIAAGDTSASQAALAWVLAQQQRAVTIPILGVRTEAQLADNLGALEIELDPAELERLGGCDLSGWWA